MKTMKETVLFEILEKARARVMTIVSAMKGQIVSLMFQHFKQMRMKTKMEHRHRMT